MPFEPNAQSQYQSASIHPYAVGWTVKAWLAQDMTFGTGGG